MRKLKKNSQFFSLCGKFFFYYVSERVPRYVTLKFTMKNYDVMFVQFVQSYPTVPISLIIMGLQKNVNTKIVFVYYEGSEYLY